MSTLKLFEVGDVIPGRGVVQENACGMPWPIDVQGNLYMGCVLVDGQAHDAITGVPLRTEERKARRNNMAYNYADRYKVKPALEAVYRMAFTRAVLATAMDIEAADRKGMPDTILWDQLEEGKRKEYLDLAFRKLGLKMEMFPVEESEFLMGLSKPPRSVSESELMLRRAARVEVKI